MNCELCKKQVARHTVTLNGKKHKVCDTCFDLIKLSRAMTFDRGFGGCEKKMLWNEYIRLFKTKKMRIGLEKLKKLVIKKKLLGMTGFEYQNSGLFGKYGIHLSLRAWGDFMASLMNTLEKKRKYNYINFAWNRLKKC